MALQYGANFGLNEGSGSGGTEPDGRVYVIDGAGFKSYPLDLQGPGIRAQHASGAGGGVIKENWRWDTATGQWQHPTNWTNVAALGTLGTLGGFGAAAALGGGAAASTPFVGPELAGASGVLPATTIGSGYVPAITGGTGLAGTSAGTAAGVTAAEAARNATGRAAGTAAQTYLQKALGPLLALGSGIAAHALTPNTPVQTPGTSPQGLTPEMQQIVAEAFRRMTATQPMFNDVVQKTQAGLPRR